MIDFLKYRFAALLLVILMSIGMIGVGYYRYQSRGHVFNYSVDFTGGTQMLFRFSEHVSSVDLERILSNHGWPGVVMREFAGINDILIRVKEVVTDATGLAQRMRLVLQEDLKGVDVSVLQSESVGGGIGSDLRWKSIRAVFIALAAILLYLAFRFRSFAFAIGAVVALLHDAVALLAFFLFIDMEISTNVIGAVLAVLGYSVNDTIVIFAQIRSNIPRMRGSSIEDIVNISINQTLRRTLLTTFATALTVSAMFFLGGPALYEFSLTLLVGIIIGIYSTIYMASAVMIKLYKEE